MAKLVRLSKQMTDAILTLLKFIKATTGNEPSQTEVANALKSYFILNEIGNQIKFQRKKQHLQPPADTASIVSFRKSIPFWKMNLMDGPPKNSLARVGLFYEIIQDAINTARRFVKDSGEEEPSEVEIALGLKSSFILSEIKSQIDWQRNGQKKTDKTISQTK